jgi:hypothetical protein
VVARRTEIVFTRTRDNDDQELYVVNANGTRAQTRLTTNKEFDRQADW